ncbi:hypothetical protein ACLK2I_23340 [Escherichia coli]
MGHQSSGFIEQFRLGYILEQGLAGAKEVKKSKSAEREIPMVSIIWLICWSRMGHEQGDAARLRYLLQTWFRRRT